MEKFNKEKFDAFLVEHPELRFFQGLCAFLKVDAVEVREGLSYRDTFFWEDEGRDETVKRYMPELGQAMHGNPTGWFDIPPFAEALIISILDEIDRVFWNVNQKEWDRHEDPRIEGVEVNPYYWGEDEELMVHPNLKLWFSEQEIRWYKHPGRGMSCTQPFSNQEWINWYNRAISTVQKGDTDILGINK